MSSDYLFDTILPQPTRDEPLGTAARMNLRRALLTAEDYRQNFPKHHDSSIAFLAPILPQLSQPEAGGTISALYLLPRPATMRRRTRRSALARIRHAWSVLRGR